MRLISIVSRARLVRVGTKVQVRSRRVRPLQSSRASAQSLKEEDRMRSYSEGRLFYYVHLDALARQQRN